MDEKAMNSFIIPIGRKGYSQNEVQIPDGTTVSRRHCVIINAKEDVWLVDLDSTGTYVDGRRIKNQVHLIGVIEIQIADTKLKITTDREKLI